MDSHLAFTIKLLGIVSLPYEITLLSNIFNRIIHVRNVSLPYEITLLSNFQELYLLCFMSFTTIRNYTTLKHTLTRLIDIFCFTTIRNYTTLKLFRKQKALTNGFTTIRNYTTLKLTLTTGTAGAKFHYHTKLHYSQTERQKN